MLLVKSILKTGRDAKSEKKVVFADIVEERRFCVEEGNRMRSTGKKNLRRRQKRQLKIRMEEFSARSFQKQEEAATRRGTSKDRDEEVKKQDEEFKIEDESLRSKEEMLKELQESCCLEEESLQTEPEEEKEMDFAALKTEESL